MDFFEQQRRAKRRTGWLILSFIFALFAVGLIVHAAIMLFVGATDEDFKGSVLEAVWNHPASLYVYYCTQIIVALLVVLGSVCKIRQLSEGGGEYVAEMLGGKEVSPFTLRFEEKQLLNIVEEMSIAAGIVVPAVYILEKENRINSFAAGFDQDSAVIGVTRGALDYLTRDEIQALVAHEFSHILNGDIVLNMRSIGILFGLSMISQIGLGMSLLHPDMHVEQGSTFGTGEIRNEGEAYAALALIHPGFLLTIFIGLLITVIGSVGWLMGSIIKSAICRQREFLADAAAVQYTRNPEALKSVFLKIGSPRVGSLVYSAHALEASHLFIGTIFGHLRSWNPLSTHPSWKTRIRRIDRNFDGVFPIKVAKVRRYGDQALVGTPNEAMIDELLSSTNPRLGRFFARQRIAENRRGPTRPVDPDGLEIVATIVGEALFDETGTDPSLAKTSFVPPPVPGIIVECLEHPIRTASVFFALLLDKDESVRKNQIAELKSLGRKIRIVSIDEIQKISDAIVRDFSVEQTMQKTAQARKLRSAFIRIRNRTLREGLPKLRELSPADYADSRRVCSHLTGDVNKINLFRYALFAAFRHDLDPRFQYGELHRPDEKASKILSLSAVEPSLRLALSYLAYAGHADHDEACSAFQAGLRAVKLPASALRGNLLPISDCTFRALDESLRRMQAASEPIREKCLKALRTVLWNDGKMTAREEEILLTAEAMLG